MPDYSNLSVDSIRKNSIESGENSQTYLILNKSAITFANFIGAMNMSVFTSGLIDDEIKSSRVIENSMSVSLVDTEVSSKYPLTLKEARNRALHAIATANKEKSLTTENED